MNDTILSVRKTSEGGPGQRATIQLLKRAGIKAQRAHSPYVGQTGVMILSHDKRVIARAERLVFGR